MGAFMYNNELLFVDKFLSTLKDIGVDKIPFRNDKYHLGVREMQKCFRKMELEIDRKLHDIKLLFLESGEGDFAQAILELNDGKSISFELHNPYYEEASIKMNKKLVSGILSDTELELSNEKILELTKAFCKGADVKSQFSKK